MRPMLDDLELPQVQEIATHDRRVLAEHKPPGMAGSLLQNMGRRPARLVLWGVATGPGALEFVEELDGKFRAGNPLPFIADIIAEAEIEQVVIDDLQWQELAGKPERFAYVLALREYIEPLEPEMATRETQRVDKDVTSQATAIQETVENQTEVRQGTLEVIVEPAEPSADLSQVQIHVQGQTEDGHDYTVILEQQTNGVFRKTDVPAGQYTITLLST